MSNFTSETELHQMIPSTHTFSPPFQKGNRSQGKDWIGDGIPNYKQPNKAEMTPHYFYGLHLLTFFKAHTNHNPLHTAPAIFTATCMIILSLNHDWSHDSLSYWHPLDLWLFQVSGHWEQSYQLTGKYGVYYWASLMVKGRIMHQPNVSNTVDREIFVVNRFSLVPYNDEN